jgi:glycosyltransferase involved in cell wall biosynthesis
MESASQNQNKKMKVLWSSNATFAPTGYGTQTNLAAYGLLRSGFDVRVAANYGLEGAALGFNDLVQYPRLFAEFGEDALKLIIDTWKPDVFVTLYDIWIGARSNHFGIGSWFAALHPRWIPWIPIDQYPIPDPVVDQAQKAYKCVAMSEFGRKELERVGIKAACIPHGIDTKVFKPAADKKACKAWLGKHSSAASAENGLGIDENSFVVGINAANKDPFRKDFARMFTAFQIFLENNPDAKKDARLFVHSWMQFPGGFNLYHLAKKLAISQYVRHTYTYDMFCGLPPEKMAMQYNGFDAYLNLCRGGGFEIGHIESAACGVPSIGVDFTAMTELIQGHGWLVPPYAKEVQCPDCKKKFSYNGGALQFTHLISTYAIPDEWKAAEAIEDAYNHPVKVKNFGKKSRKFAVDGYDFESSTLPKWVDLLGEVQSELGMFGKAAVKNKAFDELFAKAVT